MFEQLVFLYLYYQTTVFEPPAGVPKLENAALHLFYSDETKSGQAILPRRNHELIAPILSAKSVFAVDIDSGMALFQKNIHARTKIASIGKLVTAMVILDSHKLDELVRVPAAATQVAGQKAWLLADEELTVRDLLYALLIHSANDAAVTLAYFDSGSESEFVEKMNLKAAELGLENTRFTNSHGLDDYDNYSTAFDVAQFAHAAYSYDFIRETVKMPKLTILSTDRRIAHELETTNELLKHSDFDIVGLKTGRTDGAGEAFVGITNHPRGPRIMTVVIQSDDRFGETEFLLDWLFRAYSW